MTPAAGRGGRAQKAPVRLSAGARSTGVDSAPARSRLSDELLSRRFHELVVGLMYVGLFCSALFLDVYVRMQLKSNSLEVWTLSRRKAEIESEITRLDMRLTVLESPMRLESLASSEIGLTAAVPQQQTPTKKQ